MSNAAASTERRGKLRVLMVSQRARPEHVSGAPMQAWALGRQLRALDCDVTMLSTRFVAGQRAGRQLIDGLPGYRLPSVSSWPLLKPTQLFGAALFVATRRQHFDVVHCHSLSATTLGAIAGAKLCGLPVITKQSLAGPEGDLAVIRRSVSAPLLLALLRSADRQVTISTTIARELLAAGVAPRRLWPTTNGVDLARFAPASERRRAELRSHFSLEHSPAVLFVGQLSRRKGVDRLLEAWRRVRRTATQPQLLIAGDGPLRREVRAAARSDQRVRYLQRRDDVAQLMQASDVFVLPSHHEGFSNVVVEALASGLPVVVGHAALDTRIDLPRWAGCAIEPSSARRLASALVDQIELLDGDANAATLRERRRDLVRRFDIRELAREYLQLYEELTTRGRGRA